MAAVETIGPLVCGPISPLFGGGHYPLTAHGTHVRGELHFGQGLACSGVLIERYS